MLAFRLYKLWGHRASTYTCTCREYSLGIEEQKKAAKRHANKAGEGRRDSKKSYFRQKKKYMQKP